MINGIDLSHWETVESWSKLSASRDPHIQFGYTKLTQGTSFLDNKANEIVKGFQAIGRPVGVYLVNECHKDSQAQVDWFKKCLAKIPKTELRHCIDFEGAVNEKNPMALNRAKCLEMIRIFRKEFGYKPLFYCNSSNLKSFKFTDAEASEFDMWVANYGVEEKALLPIYGVKKYLMWQRSDKKDVPGVGPCDYNNLYGTVEDLRVKPASVEVPKPVEPKPADPKPTPYSGGRKDKFLALADARGYAKQAHHVLDFVTGDHDPRYYALMNVSKRSSEKRFSVYDCDTGTVKDYLVAHGSGSDPNNDGLATEFSDEAGSLKTSLGVYYCAELYLCSKHGWELRLDGKETSNAHARKRAIVMHRAKYVTNSHVGRSSGCPALRLEDADEVINQLTKGSYLYIFRA